MLRAFSAVVTLGRCRSLSRSHAEVLVASRSVGRLEDRFGSDPFEVSQRRSLDRILPVAPRHAVPPAAVDPIERKRSDRRYDAPDLLSRQGIRFGYERMKLTAR